MNNTGGRKKGIRNFSLRMQDETLEKLHYVSSCFGRSANGQLLAYYGNILKNSKRGLEASALKIKTGKINAYKQDAIDRTFVCIA